MSESSDSSDMSATSLLKLLRNTNGQSVYNEAERVHMSLMGKLSLWADMAYASLQLTVISIFLLLKSIIMFVVPKKEEDISGHLALVTGGGNGLGRELCRELARAGARVAVVDIDGAAARGTAELLGGARGHGQPVARAYVADVSDPDAVSRLAEEVRKDWNRPVDILVNNAGLLAPVSLFNGENSDVSAIIDVNLKSHFWMLRAFVPAMMAANKGHVVSISSMAGLVALSRACCYTATKFGLRGLSLSLQAELNDAGLRGVRVSVAYPYFLATRKELVDSVKLRIPPLSPEFAAKKIVSGLRKNQLEIGIPSHLMYFGTIMGMLPDDMAELFRTTFHTDIKIK